MLIEQRKQLEQQIIEKVLKDESFRRQLIDDPKFILEYEMGMKIPDSFNIKIVEEDSQTFYLVLPAKINPETDEDELTEADLEMVSGGYGGEGEGEGGDPVPPLGPITQIIN